MTAAFVLSAGAVEKDSLSLVRQNKARYPGKTKTELRLENDRLRKDLDSLRCELERYRRDLNIADSINNDLMTIYAAVTGKTFEEIETEFAGHGYGKFKPVVGEAVVEHLRPIREESMKLMKDKAYLESVYRDGAQKASYVDEKTLRKVYKKVGFLQR